MLYLVLVLPRAPLLDPVSLLVLFNCSALAFPCLASPSPSSATIPRREGERELRGREGEVIRSDQIRSDQHVEKTEGPTLIHHPLTRDAPSNAIRTKG